MLRLPWYQESAFRAWIKKSCTAAATAVTTIATGSAPWKPTLLVAGGYILADFLLSVPDIFFLGPDVFRPEDAPKEG